MLTKIKRSYRIRVSTDSHNYLLKRKQTMASNTHPNFEDIKKYIEELEKKKNPFLKIRIIGQSVQGRDIHCLLITDPEIRQEEKQHVMIAAGQHGSEESGRASALELIDFLLSGKEECPEILKNTVVAIIPCSNPDSSMTDQYHNADDVNVAHDYALDGPSTNIEGQALENFANEFIPDFFCDIHGRAGGGMKGCIWLTPPMDFTPDRLFLTCMGVEIHKAAEKKGYPQTEFKVPGSFRKIKGNHATLGNKLCWELKTLCCGMETIEHYYTEPDWRVSGLARLRAMLFYPCTDTFGLGIKGYPNILISGYRTHGLIAHGLNAAQRRANRVEMSNFIKNNFCSAERDADGLQGCCRVRIISETVTGKNPQRFSVLTRFKNPCTINRVSFDNEKLSESNEHGYEIREDDISTFVKTNLLKPFGGPERHLTINYDSPYLPDR